MTLDSVIIGIVFNEDIHNLLMNISRDEPLREHPYKKLVEFQRNAYKKECLNIKDKGFQIGEPWNGDINNALVAFISSNPAFGPYDSFPRYHAVTKTVSMPDGETLDLDGIKKFFNDRFKNATVSKREVLRVKCNRAGDGVFYKAIPYWGCVRNSIKALWPNAPKGDSTEAYVKGLMSKAVCMELVPFKSRSEIGVDDALLFCLKNFTRHILSNITAPIVVLVGKKVRYSFLNFYLKDENEWGEASQAFDNKEIYHYGDKLFVATNFSEGGFKLSNCCSVAAMDELRKTFGGGLN